MAKFHKLAKELVKELGEGRYLSVVLGLQDPDIVIPLHEMVFRKPKDISENEIEGLRDVLKASKALYELNQYMSGVMYKLMPDATYDTLIEMYKKLKNDDEPFQAFIPSGMRSVEQDFPELSGTLDKAYEVYNITEKPSVEKWLKKTAKELGVKRLKLIIAPKFDGTSVTVSYEKHCAKDKNEMIPTKAITRGDFENNLGVDLYSILEGRDPLYISDGLCERIPMRVGIQYEAMMTEYGREKLSKIVGITYSTRRAAIASALKRISNPKTPKDELREINKCITLVPLMIDNGFIDVYSGTVEFPDLMDAVNSEFYLGDKKRTLEYGTRIIDGTVETLLEQFQGIVKEYSEKRSSLNYSIDGLVLSIADYDHIETIGRSSNKNKWQIAYKFDAMVQRTKITGIISSMGKQGFIGHNVTFNPIEFNGVGYDKAPVNNIARFKELSPHIDDEVLVSYNADVMGYIYKDNTCKPSGGEVIELPTECPNCGSELVVLKDMLKCINDECPGHKIGRILEAIRIFNLDYFGEETANGIVMDAGITNATEFIQMRYEDLAKVLKGLNLEKAWEEFQNKIKAPIEYPKVIDLLRIPNLRTKTAEKILEDIHIKELKEMMLIKDEKVLLKKLQAIKGIDKKAKDFATSLIEAYPEFSKLCKLLNCIDPIQHEWDKQILISGFRTNAEFSEICKRLNFNILESGSKYDLLVVTPDRFNGSKADKARKKGIPIMILSEFIETY